MSSGGFREQRRMYRKVNEADRLRAFSVETALDDIEEAAIGILIVALHRKRDEVGQLNQP